MRGDREGVCPVEGLLCPYSSAEGYRGAEEEVTRWSGVGNWLLAAVPLEKREFGVPLPPLL